MRVPSISPTSHAHLLQRKNNLISVNDDGNVIIVAEITLFRVHEGILARHSSVLLQKIKDARKISSLDFSLPDVVEDCPVVRVNDSAHDFKHMLRILYDGFEYVPAHPTTTTSLVFVVKLTPTGI